jgi:uncharacterized protein
MMMDLIDFQKKSQEKWPENQKFLHRLKDKRTKQLDERFHQAHEAVFAKTNCLQCANCCKTTSPIFKDVDIDRIAKHLRLRPADFVSQYLMLDADRDFVLKTSPCAFLGSDNTCRIYEVRPRACREYPHTDRKNIAGILNLTAQNTRVCPAVFDIVERLKKVYS